MASDTAMEVKQNDTEIEQTEPTRGGRHYRPNVDIVERPNELTVFADMPGVQSDDLDINFENGELSIYGKVQPRQQADATFLMQEYGTGDFFRTFRVSEAIDATKISAEYNHGVLTLHLPKVEAIQPRKITVRAS